MLTFWLGIRKYNVDREWANLPDNISLDGTVGISINNEGNILVLKYDDPFLLIFSPKGELLDQWSMDSSDNKKYGHLYVHYLKVTEDGRVWIVDRDNHRIVIFNKDGKVIQVIGDPEKPGKLGTPFNHPTDIAINKDGEFFVTDGYGNSNVHHFDSSGKLIKSWGKPGAGEGEFTTPHGIIIDEKDRLWVADRENNRVQIFNQEGEYLSEINDLYHPMSIVKDHEGYIYVSDQIPRINMFNPNGELMGRFLSFGSYAHSIVVDSKSNIYAADMNPEGITKFTYVP